MRSALTGATTSSARSFIASRYTKQDTSADDQATQRSSQGYTFGLGSGSVSWRATRSSSVLGSSCEAEIYAGAMAAQELRWLTYLLTDLGEPPRSPPVLYVDNKAMLALCREQRLEHRTKHIALRYFLARELQQRGQLRLAYVASDANTADVFTKALAPCDHQRCCTQLGLLCFALLDWSLSLAPLLRTSSPTPSAAVAATAVVPVLAAKGGPKKNFKKAKKPSAAGEAADADAAAEGKPAKAPKAAKAAKGNSDNSMNGRPAVDFTTEAMTDSSITVRVDVAGSETAMLFDGTLRSLAKECPPLPGARLGKGGRLGKGRRLAIRCITVRPQRLSALCSLLSALCSLLSAPPFSRCAATPSTPPCTPFPFLLLPPSPSILPFPYTPFHFPAPPQSFPSLTLPFLSPSSLLYPLLPPSPLPLSQVDKAVVLRFLGRSRVIGFIITELINKSLLAYLDQMRLCGGITAPLLLCMARLTAGDRVYHHRAYQQVVAGIPGPGVAPAGDAKTAQLSDDPPPPFHPRFTPSTPPTSPPHLPSFSPPLSQKGVASAGDAKTTQSSDELQAAYEPGKPFTFTAEVPFVKKEYEAAAGEGEAAAAAAAAEGEGTEGSTKVEGA
ncbi:unnamed protein product [Closterium sp. NIES-53]